jgi:hypothetical protein
MPFVWETELWGTELMDSTLQRNKKPHPTEGSTVSDVQHMKKLKASEEKAQNSHSSVAVESESVVVAKAHIVN